MASNITQTCHALYRDCLKAVKMIRSSTGNMGILSKMQKHLFSDKISTIIVFCVY